MLRSLLGRFVVAAGLAATAYAGVPAAPAVAAGCASAHGVTVVVDFHELGGGVQSACVADGGGWTAGDLFPTAGYPLDRVQSQPGFVCRVAGKPSDGDACSHTPPADAYWGLWWSDGKSGSWTYASAGADSQHVPEGGYVAFSWNGSADRSSPGYRPAPHPTSSPSPTPSPSPTHSSSPTHAPSQAPTHDAGQPASSAPAAGGTGSASASTTTGPTESPTRAPTGTARARKPRTTDSSPTGSASATPSPSASASAVVADPPGPAGPGDGGLPGWVAPVVIAALFGTAGAVAVVRRRRSPA